MIHRLVRAFWDDTRAQAILEYVLVVAAFFVFAGMLEQLVEGGYGQYVKGLYYVLSLPAP